MNQIEIILEPIHPLLRLQANPPLPSLPPLAPPRITSTPFIFHAAFQHTLELDGENIWTALEANQI